MSKNSSVEIQKYRLVHSHQISHQQWRSLRLKLVKPYLPSQLNICTRFLLNQLLSSHTDQFLVEMFHNYTFKECISVEKLRLWLLILAKTLFLMTILIKLTLGNIFIKVKKSASATVIKQLIFFFKCR